MGKFDFRPYLQVSSKENINTVLDILLDNPDYIPDLLNLAFSDEGKISWRASWATAHLGEKYPGLVRSYLDQIIRKIPLIKQDNQKGLLIRMLRKSDIPTENAGHLIDVCISLIFAEKKQQYLKCYAIEFLYKLSEKIPELKNELTLVLREAIPLWRERSLIRKANKILACLENIRNTKAN